MLFKIELLRVWYGLSAEGVEEMVNDRISFSRFVGLSLAEPAPDSTTVLRFRSAMSEAGTLDQVLRKINRQLEAQGLVVKSEAIIDASVTDSPRRSRGRGGGHAPGGAQAEHGRGGALDPEGRAAPLRLQAAHGDRPQRDDPRRDDHRDQRAQHPSLRGVPASGRPAPGHPHLRRQGLRLGGESGGGSAHGVQGPHHAPGSPREGALGALAAAQRGD